MPLRAGSPSWPAPDSSRNSGKQARVSVRIYVPRKVGNSRGRRGVYVCILVWVCTEVCAHTCLYVCFPDECFKSGLAKGGVGSFLHSSAQNKARSCFGVLHHWLVFLNGEWAKCCSPLRSDPRPPTPPCSALLHVRFLASSVVSSPLLCEAPLPTAHASGWRREPAVHRERGSISGSLCREGASSPMSSDVRVHTQTRKENADL